MSSDGFFEDIDETDLVKFEPIESVNQELENFDAFNEETFDAALEGDWEAEHDKLLLLENLNETESEHGFNGTLTKFTEFDENKNQQENDYEDINDNTQLKQSKINQFAYTDANNSRFENAACLQNLQINQESKQNLGQFNETQFKLMQQQQQQLQHQIFQQNQIQKNQLLQQQQKQFQLASLSQQLTQEQRMQLEKLNLQQLNPAMLAAAIIARNNQMQNNLLNNPQQFVNTNIQMNNINNDLNRKTPISFNNTNNNNFNGNMLNMMQHQMQPTNNESPFSNKENTYSTNYSTNSINNINNNLSNQQSLLNYSGNQVKIASYQPNESESIKLKNLLEKINTNESNINSNINVTSQTHGASNSTKAPVENMLMLAMLHQQSNQALPKLPPVKVKTLEEIENELLSSNQPNTSSQAYFSKPNDQQESTNLISNLQNQTQRMNALPNQSQLDMLKLFPMLNSSNNYMNNNELDSTNILLQKQKHILEQMIIHQNQQQFIKQQQIIQQQNTINNEANQRDLQQQKQHMMLMQQQQNLNAFLPPNFQSLNQPQKQLVLAQIHRNLQSSIIQQQMAQNQQSNLNQLRQEEFGNNIKINTQQLDQFNRFNNDLNNNPNFNKMNNFNNDNNKRINNNNNSNMNRHQQQQNTKNDKEKKNKSHGRNNSSNADKLAGMMTDKEKNWVVNVQMLQLQIDDPYKYDFYYTAWMLKKKQFSLRNTSSSGLKTSVLYQLMNNKQDHSKSYRPLTFENSLGKVTMSNFHHPRALIDLDQRLDEHTDSSLVTQLTDLDFDDDKHKEAKNIDTILLEIEKMYQVLLNIDEIEHSILKANDEMRIILFQERRAKVDKLALMLCTENFAHYLFVDKGKRLLGKCIPTFNLAQTKLILGFFIQHVYIIAKNNISLDDIYSTISYAIDTQKFGDLVDIVNQFVHLYSRQSTQLYHSIFSNKFCLTFLLKFFSKSELINQDDFENETKANWSCFINLVLIGLSLLQPISTHPEGGCAWNISEIYPLNLSSILENFDVNTELWSKNEKKLCELFAYQ